MRAEIVMAAGCLILVSCGPSQNALNSPAAESTKQQPSDESPRPTRGTNALEHFWFAYPFQPQPGNRVWINVGQTNWVEVYPDGSQSRYRLLGREAVDGLSGVVVSKTEGDIHTTQTLNDGSFQAFLPETNSARMVLYFRNKIEGQWQSWRPLAEIHPIK